MARPRPPLSATLRSPSPLRGSEAGPQQRPGAGGYRVGGKMQNYHGRVYRDRELFNKRQMVFKKISKERGNEGDIKKRESTCESPLSLAPSSSILIFSSLLVLPLRRGFQRPSELLSLRFLRLRARTLGPRGPNAHVK